jgi:hypothetical protein
MAYPSWNVDIQIIHPCGKAVPHRTGGWVFPKG